MEGEDNDSADISGLAKLNRVEWLWRSGRKSKRDGGRKQKRQKVKERKTQQKRGRWRKWGERICVCLIDKEECQA